MKVSHDSLFKFGEGFLEKLTTGINIHCYGIKDCGYH